MSTAVAAPGSRRFTREDVVHVGQAGRPWEFVPLAVQAVRLAPEDWGMRVLLAANLASLGLKSLATEQIGVLPEALRSDESVRGLAGAVAAMPPDRIALEALEANVRTGTASLADRGIDLTGGIARWKAAAGGWEWFRAKDGNMVRRRGEQWLGLSDHRGAAAAFGREHLAKPNPQMTFLTIEGIDPPWLLQEVARRSERNKDGFWMRLLIVQADTMEFLDGLAQADLSGVLSQDRTVICVGPDAGGRLLTELRGRSGGRLTGAYIPQLATRTRTSPPVPAVLEQAEAEQLAEHERLAAQVRETYTGRDREWWRARFAGGSPLRVLVPSCRYTTFVKHSGADLVEAFKRSGCQAELLIEPDDSFRFATVAYLRAIARFKPDVVVLVNYTRGHLGDWLPRELPFVTWIQDAMPHLFDPKLGASLGDTDFVVGHLHAELFARCGYPRERTMATPVVASDSKFHAGPVDAALRQRLECEIAMVSHHSETPERMRDRMMEEAAAQGSLRRALSRIYERAAMLAGDLGVGSLPAAVGAVVAEELRAEHAGEPDGAGMAYLARSYAMPLVDRMVRHQTLHWAADAAERRGWRLHLYGRGWETHPRFGAYAKGELAHGEALRAAYQCATVQLHASALTITHQRVMECALSGGFPLCRLLGADIAAYRWAGEQAASRREDPTVGDPVRRMLGHRVADHPECRWNAKLQRWLGHPSSDFCWVSDRRRAIYRKEGEPLDTVWLLEDPTDSAFATAPHLEESVGRAERDPQWRAAVSGAIAQRVRRRLTTDSLAQRLVAMVTSHMNGPVP